MSIINSHVKIEKGIRKAVQIDRTELEQKIIDKCSEIIDYYDDDDDEEIDLKEDICEVIDDFEENINGDRNIVFSTENINIDKQFIEKTNHLIGFHTLENGLSFMGIEAGGDWEEPLFLILYFDGENIRMYIPFHGNCFNSDFMTAFGSEDSAEAAYLQHISENEVFQRIEDRYKKLGLWNKFVPDESKFTWSTEKAMELFNMEYLDHDFDWDAIKEEIITAIEIVPTNN